MREPDPEIPSRSNLRETPSRPEDVRIVTGFIAGTDKSMAQVVEGICARLDKPLELYGPVERIEEIRDSIVDRKKQLNRLVELQSQTMATAQEHEEIEYLKRLFRRYVYDLTRQKAQDRIIRGKNGTAISTLRS